MKKNFLESGIKTNKKTAVRISSIIAYGIRLNSCARASNAAVMTGLVLVAGIVCGSLGDATPVSAATYTYNIVYDDGVISDMPASGSASSYSDTVPISSQTPTRDGYTFLGWCNTLPTTSDGSDTCSGTSYLPGGNFTLDQISTTNSLSLYTMWAIKPKTMQSVTASDLAALMPNTGDTTTLPDARDGQEYTIAKLADGKYWMTTNLNLAGGTTLNASDSNVPSDNYYTLPASSTSGFSDNTVAYVYNSGNTTSTCSSPGCYSYYSWLAATAGGKDSSGNAVSTNGYNAAYSICPKGWRLPTSTTSNASAATSPNWKTGDWYALATAYGANLESNYYESAATFYNNAGPGTTPNFLLAGNYGYGSFGTGGSYGRYWSSTAASSTAAYYLNFNSGRVDSASSNTRRYGYSVRCVYGS